ncbi:MAG: tetratricopeptide repeat protein [Nevskiaceae bacterium]|nr:MAG: tetratricopeptide repeat protein [Nevskiaceae bacterium]
MNRLQLSSLAIGVAAFLAACGSPPNLRPQDKSPAIRSLAKQKAPDQNKLPIILSDPLTPDPEKALDNYRKILELAPDEAMRAETMRRMADLQVQVDDATGGTGESEKLLAESIKLYRQLIEERPDDPNNDRVLYQLARAYQNAGKPELSVATLTELTARYPDSPLNGDAHFRRAELLFRLGNYAEAEKEYHYVMGLAAATPFFEPSQYKYGWSLFKQSKFDDALPVFFAILDRELPPGELQDVEASLNAVSQGKADLAKDSLRVTSLTFAVMGGGPAMNQYFASHPEPRFYPLLYTALGEMFLDKLRYTDAAGAFAAFNERHPGHPTAPQFQARVIEVYKQGGFNDLVAREKERYVNAYAPGAPYWAGATPSAEVMTALRGHLEDLAKHHHAFAQQDPQANQAAYLVAAGWYRRILDIFPSDPRAPEINFLQAEALEDGGKLFDAAREFSRTAYDYPPHARAPDAAYAAVLAYHRNVETIPAAQKNDALRVAIDASLKMVDTFPAHPQALAVLTRTARDLYDIGAQAEAVSTAQRVLAYTPPPTPEQRRIVQGVLGDSYFAQKDYPKAEVAYADLLKLTPADDPLRANVIEQLAASIYKQAEAARAAGDLKTAAQGFLRVGQVTPQASIRDTADYDAAAALIGLQDWGSAAVVLEGLRNRNSLRGSGWPLETDVDKKLALVYVKDNKPVDAAAAYRRIAARVTEAPEVRREAGWQAAKLFDDAKRPADAIRAYEFYVGAFPSPLEPAVEARRRLADLYRAKPDPYRALFWLRDLVAADDRAGSQRTERTRVLAAQAALDIGRAAAADAARIRLSLPVERSLPMRKDAVENAIQALEKAASYNYAETTTAAAYELGMVYQSFAKALMDSERPRNLAGEELEQYNLLLEEQSLPFEEKAIQAHETNLKRVGQGLWDPAIAGSVAALGALSPAKYGKRETGAEVYESLK